jgi:hypothetical protein
MIDSAIPSLNPSRSEEVRFAEHLEGPPGVANGGILAGTLAARLEGPAEVTLSQPAPVGRSLRLSVTSSTATLSDGERLLATARQAPLSLPPVPALAYEDAVAAASRFPRGTVHPFPNCFVCGTTRTAHDGLLLLPGPTEDGASVAAPWEPHEHVCRAVAGGDVSEVPAPVVFAALDCPGAWSFLISEPGRMVLGRMSAVQVRPMRVGARHVVTGWQIGRQGRKHFCGTAIHDDQGRLAAFARSTWLTI